MSKKQNYTRAEARRVEAASLTKMIAMVGFVVAVIAFSSIAWFTMNREVEGSGVQMRADDLPYEIRTTGSAALYQSRTNEIFPNLPNQNATSGNYQTVSWFVGEGSNIENYKDDDKTLREITKIDSSDYGLSPGDYGVLKCTIVPKDENEDLNLKFTTKLTGYSAEYDNDGYETNDNLTLVSDAEVNRYLCGHILFFYARPNGSSTDVVMIENNEFDMTISGETEITLFWVWTETLRNILSMNIPGLDDNMACDSVRNQLYAHPELFLERSGIPADGNKPFDEMTISPENDGNISSVSESILEMSKKYEKYSSWYNNADQSIGDAVSYISFEMMVEPQIEDE